MNKCPHCGATATASEDIKIITCEYCNSSFENENFKEKIVEDKPQIINNYYTNSNPNLQKVPRTKRPKVRFLFTIFLFFFNPLIAIFYIILTKAKQKRWDDKYTY